MSQLSTSTNRGDDAVLTNFSQCHEGIVAHLKTFGELPALLEPAARAHQIARETLQFFQQAVFDHHAEEEKDLFPAVLGKAVVGEERDRVQKMVDELKAEHRAIESLWVTLEPQLEKFAKGQAANVDASAIEHLVRKYIAHARLEEAELLPLSEKILGRDSPEMAQLGLSLHMRQLKKDLHRHGLRGS